jgi:hypothetical protein
MPARAAMTCRNPVLIPVLLCAHTYPVMFHSQRWCSRMRSLPALIGAALVAISTISAPAQTGGEQKPPEGQKAAEPAKDQKKIDEFAEAIRVLGGPASHPECVWLGRRVVNLMWRDDLDTAFRHLELYDRFGCPGGHIQASFRCLVRHGQIDPKALESLNARVHACWINPTMPPAQNAQPAQGAPPSGTKPQ